MSRRPGIQLNSLHQTPIFCQVNVKRTLVPVPLFAYSARSKNLSLDLLSSCSYSRFIVMISLKFNSSNFSSTVEADAGNIHRYA